MSNPNFSADEQAFTNQVLALADPQKLGIVPGDLAVNLFAGSNIPADTLGDIWQIADSENNGFLTRKGLGIALRLMSHVQFGEKVDESLVNKPAPPPTIKGVTPFPAKPSTPASMQRPVPATPTPRPVPPIPVRPSTVYAPILPLLTAEDRAKFTKIFAQSGPVAGLLSGEKARYVFLKSKLPFDTLGQIWVLADTQSRGALDLTDFILGMYFIQSTMNKSIPTLPATLPAELYEQASGGRTVVASPSPVSPISRQPTGQQPIATHTTGGSFHGASSPGFVSQFPSATPAVQRTGSISRVTAVPTGSSIASPWTRQPVSTTSWDITPVEKASADRFFASLDKANVGSITGDIAVPFMLESKLPESVLAQIWDLADMDNLGQLDRDGFAVAMHLINGQLAGKDLPLTLPLSLIPPTKRSTTSIQAPGRPVDDLFSLFDDQPVHQATFPPVATGSRQIPGPTPDVPHTHPDLLGDEDVAEPVPPVSDRSAEVGTLRNQLASTQRSLEKSKSERTTLETQIADHASQIAQLESQLAAANAAHDAETQLLSTVRTRAAEQVEQIRKLKEDLIRAESDLSATRLEKTEIETALLRDKEDVRDMQKRMKAIGDDVDKVKSDLEKSKNDARLQKGLVAIAKKQLASAEAEKAKFLDALAAVQRELEEAKQQVKEAETAAAATLASIPGQSVSGEQPQAIAVASADMSKPMTIPLPETPEPGATPSVTSSKSNNPFDKLTRGMSSGGNTPQSAVSTLPVATSIPAESVGLNVDRDMPAESVKYEVPTSGEVVMPSAISTTSQEHPGEDPFGLESQDAQPSGQPASFDDIFGPNTVDLHISSPAAFAAQTEVAASSESEGAGPANLSSQRREKSDALQDAENHFPALNAVDEDLPPLREVEHADDDSSEDEFQSTPQTGRSVPESVTLDHPATTSQDDAQSTVPSTTTSVAAHISSAEIVVPQFPENKALPTSAPAKDDDFFGSGFTVPNVVVGPTLGHSVALDDFDEAMGQMAASKDAIGSFQFDSAFDSTSSAPAISPAAVAAPQPSLTQAPVNGDIATASAVNGETSVPSAAKVLADAEEFDSVFHSVRQNGSTVTQESATPSLSFDDAFVVPLMSGPAQPPKTENTRSIFAANMPSPRTPQRRTTSKNRGLILNPNMPAVFHAELAPPQMQRTEGVATPALPDDVDAVKQLCGMGFTRSQAVEALEKYSYDVSKALNSLLR
ncbi:hypothetical protein DACRYDRAFT_118778 [Dacryopinax primogenitus]|uniref:EF-hand n=1 Tax=Dacryopinax primogenitus (strain DJM 731) TaxID=1858805 RepID=M5G440_DACPD|nr:uncharacterized protein DACRYDRAFT_118778 [Dacryopinax primogenitus]EJT98522.1 hypothetical protein DACRYDRAFT_118778 [Dacryopinax primogenitus]